MSEEALNTLNKVIDRWNDGPMKMPDPVEFAKAKASWAKLFEEYKASHDGRMPSLGEAMTFILPDE